jgi:hypothetical protein
MKLAKRLDIKSTVDEIKNRLSIIKTNREPTSLNKVYAATLDVK